MQRDADLRASFDDFTFYADPAATAAKTYLSVPAILTGQAFDNGMPVRDFLDRAYLQEGSLPFRLRADARTPQEARRPATTPATAACAARRLAARGKRHVPRRPPAQQAWRCKGAGVGLALRSDRALL